MKKWYASVLPTLLLAFNGCSKDMLGASEQQFLGVWEVTYNNNYRPGSVTPGFGAGSYQFDYDHSFSFTGQAGVTYKGKWQSRGPFTSEYCDNCNTESPRTLSISAANSTSGDRKSDFFNVVRFTADDQFHATIINGTQTLVLNFRKK